jgi:hypothetical protein
VILFSFDIVNIFPAFFFSQFAAYGWCTDELFFPSFLSSVLLVIFPR